LNTEVRHVVLVGLPGAGKSTVARALAERLGWDLVELDDEAERIAGRTIAQVFAADGETGFRRLEAEATRGLLDRTQPAVVSAGGGWMGNAGARELVPGGWPTLYLRVSPAVAASRLGELARRRPLLVGAGSPEGVLRRLEELARDRGPLYERADAVVPTDGVTVEEVVSRAAAEVERLLSSSRPASSGVRSPR
jgi:shikimate kinase